jgi:hypothetical protein
MPLSLLRPSSSPVALVPPTGATADSTYNAVRLGRQPGAALVGTPPEDEVAEIAVSLTGPLTVSAGIWTAGTVVVCRVHRTDTDEPGYDLDDADAATVEVASDMSLIGLILNDQLEHFDDTTCAAAVTLLTGDVNHYRLVTTRLHPKISPKLGAHLAYVSGDQLLLVEVWQTQSDLDHALSRLTAGWGDDPVEQMPATCLALDIEGSAYLFL